MVIAVINVWDLIGSNSNQIIALCALLATRFAYLGIKTWKKQLIGSSRYQKAKEVLKAVYNVRNIFRDVRNPLIYHYEYKKEFLNGIGQPKSDKDYEITLHIYDSRWKFLSKAFAELENLHLEAQVEWGKEYAEKIYSLRKCYNKLNHALEDYIESKNPSNKYPVIIDNEITSIIFSSLSPEKPNEFSLEIEESVEEFDVWLRPFINKKKSWKEKWKNRKLAKLSYTRISFFYGLFHNSL